MTVVQIASERRPAFQAVIERLGNRRALGDALSLLEQPSMEGIGDRPSSFLAYGVPSVWVKLRYVTLHFVQRAEVPQRRLGQFALVLDVQIEELPARMGKASDLGDPVLEASLVAAVVIAHQLAAPLAEESAGMLAGAAVGEVVNHCLQISELRGAVCLQVSAMGLALARREHLHRCLVGVQHVLLQQFLL